ncbi:hypothetical protein B296_00006059 [Ensete ventricosum]|uniref:Uncharacterized protein n=1 Tax=Ensete ventricosum TaxID=4639 RepID=A0A427B1U6_ENSVE|nr:hypothetical protein B296_00006059 [Ensete ventricosum]
MAKAFSGATAYKRQLCHPWLGRKGRPLAVSSQGPTGSGQPIRGYYPWPALTLVGAAAPAASVVAPWQGGYQPQAATSARAAMPT